MSKALDDFAEGKPNIKPKEFVATGQSIEDAMPKTTKDYRDDIVEAAIAYCSGDIHSPVDHAGYNRINDAVDAYHDALRKADRERK